MAKEENMFTKNILKGFAADTKLKYFIGDKLIEDYKTIGDYMNSGLTTYDSIEAGEMTIKDDAIIVRIPSTL